MFAFGPFSFDRLGAPWWLLLVPVMALLLLFELRQRPAGSVALSTASVFKNMATSMRVRLRFIPPVLRFLGLSLLIVALAGPLHGYQLRKNRAKVIDIELAFDTSGSMQQQDFAINGRSASRLDVAKQAVRSFLERRKQNDGDRFGLDRVGLVLFARYAWTQSPLTLDYGLISHELDEIKKPAENKDGTAIGSALGLSVARLRDSEAKSKVIILLTDGINNRGELDPLTAADIAKKYGIKVYTIGAGSAEEGVSTLNGIIPVRREPIDEDTMKKIAEITGGKYYRAADTDQLMAAYAEIDSLETTEVDAEDYYEYRPAFAAWALAGALLIAGSVGSRRKWFEAVP
nr:BatA [uncultured bacterium]